MNITIGRGKNGNYPVSLDGTTVGRVEKVEAARVTQRTKIWSRMTTRPQYFIFFKGLGSTARRVGVNSLKTRTMQEMRTELQKHVS